MRTCALLQGILGLSLLSFVNDPDPKETFFISIAAKSNQPLTQPLGSGTAGNDLAELPRGEVIFAKKLFKVEDALLHLGSTRIKGKPDKIEGIAVNRGFVRLNVLHGTGYGAVGAEGDPGFVPDGTLIGEYRIHYEDKTAARAPIIYGTDVRDWTDQDNSKSVRRGVLAWQGTNQLVRQRGLKLRLYVMSWENPYPRKLVTHIDYVSAMSPCAPLCAALAAEGDGASAPTPELTYNFRTKDFADERFRLVGPDAAGQARFEADGLHITLLADRAGTAPVGVATRSRIMGDFEITTSYTLLRVSAKTERPVGLEIYLATDTPRKEGLVLTHDPLGGRGSAIGVERVFENEQGRLQTVSSAKSSDAPVAVKFGLLRLTRNGAEVACSAANDANSPFRELLRVTLGNEDVTILRLAATSGGAPAGVELRIHDLRIRRLFGP